MILRNLNKRTGESILNLKRSYLSKPPRANITLNGEKFETHSSIVAWEISWTEKPGGLHPMGLPKSEFGFPSWHSDKESVCQCWRNGFDPWVRKIHWSRKQQPAPVFLPEKIP